MIKLEGLVYYWPNEDGTGAITTVTFTRRPAEEVEGMQVAEFSVKDLYGYMNAGLDMSRCRLAFADDGSPVIVEIEEYKDEDRYAYRCRPVEMYQGEAGIIMNLDKDGTIRLVSTKSPSLITYPFTSLVTVYFTKLDEPMVLRDTWSVSLKDVFADTAIYEGDIVGIPNEDYSIWAALPGPETPMWWAQS